MSIKALEKAIRIAGSQFALARAIGMKQQTVNWWIRKSKKVPAPYVIKIEKALNGAVTRHELRPDIYPIE